MLLASTWEAQWAFELFIQALTQMLSLKSQLGCDFLNCLFKHFSANLTMVGDLHFLLEYHLGFRCSLDCLVGFCKQ